jgi:LmbE family N-acetylglucosaminyl deacetylase
MLVFLAGLRKIVTEHNGEVQQEWRPKKVYHYIQWKNLEPDFVVDVTGFMDVKLKAVKAYGSQFYDPNSSEPESPITSKNFLDSVVYRANDLGRMIGVESAEGYNSERYVAVEKLDNLI